MLLGKLCIAYKSAAPLISVNLTVAPQLYSPWADTLKLFHLSAYAPGPIKVHDELLLWKQAFAPPPGIWPLWFDWQVNDSTRIFFPRNVLVSVRAKSSWQE